MSYIKAMEIDELNRTYKFSLNCEKCKFQKIVYVFNENGSQYRVNVDSPEEMSLITQMLSCPRCHN